MVLEVVGGIYILHNVHINTLFMLWSSLTGIGTPTLSPGNRLVPLGELEAVWGGVRGGQGRWQGAT